MRQIEVRKVKIELTKVILAVIVLDKRLVSGDAPVFIVSSQEEQERVALYLSKILDGMAHDLGNGVFCIIKH